MLRLMVPRSLVVVTLLVGCGDDVVQPFDTVTNPTTVDESTSDPTTGPATTTTAPPEETTEQPGSSSSSTSGSSTSTGPVDPTEDPTTTGSTGSTSTGFDTDCVPGELDCVCGDDDKCELGSTCFQGKCEKNGGDICPYEFDGNCDEGSPICPPGSDPYDCSHCAYADDGYCDEPFTCAPGTDGNDCCAAQQNGVCEEMSQGGACPDGTDDWDCGNCQWENDGYCDEPFSCPPGSDGDDCCAIPEDGKCDEVDQGGVCPDGSDWFDCGGCQWSNDGYCDEPDLCEPGTDGDDCCATPENGVCEEIGEGGDCPDHSDDWDCGYCAWVNDDYCDEGSLCPPGSDVIDCCVTEMDGICDEEDQGGQCPNGSDWFDCGGCQYSNNGFCDEPDLCDPGTDGMDCCATEKNGVCEEIGEGGDCPDHTDNWDCGYCKWANDGYCDEVTNLCPPGSDGDDC